MKLITYLITHPSDTGHYASYIAGRVSRLVPSSPFSFFHSLSFLILISSLFLYSCSSHRNSRGTAVKTPAPTHVNISAASSRPAKALLQEADKWLGTPYKYGGDKRGKGVDCSGLVNRLYADALSISLPRNSAAQAEFCKDIEKAALDIGDLVFFSPNGKGRINHVGMYIGDDCMIHASGSRGVTISRLSEPYFKRNYRRSGRVEVYERLLASDSTSKKKKKKSQSSTDDNLCPPSPAPAQTQSPTPPTTSLSVPASQISSVLSSVPADTVSSVSPASLTPSTTSAPSRQLPTIKVRVKTPADSLGGVTVVPVLPVNPDLDDLIDQKVDSICSSFFD